MSRVKIRFVITGACYVSYTGKQMEVEVPLEQPDGSATTVLQMEKQLRNEWPEDLGKMQDSIQSVGMSILKSGRLLQSANVVKDQLTRTELEECTIHDEQSAGAVLMHLVLKAPKPDTPDASRSSKQVSRPNGSNTGSQNNPDSRNVKDDNCCRVM